ncbi:MAG TPA: mechanosensitive ion channel family protein [Candidatus Binatia bacterium]|nr:mechanosensitive ion channel family protein [Candidatus Binatia bacterium]
MDVDQIIQTVTAIGVAFGLKVVGAIVVWVVGRYLIGLAVRLVSSALEKQRVDPTVLRYLGTVISVTLNIILVVAILGYFGVETTTFAAIMASAGVAIGLAWSGLLANFAAGAFMIVLRPIKVGDFVTVGGVTGTVKEIGLFVTAVNTLDNVLTIVGNNKIFADIIQNYSINPYRRVDLKAQLNHAVDHNVAIQLLKERLAKIPNVKVTPPPDLEILEFNLAGPVLAVRPYCHTDHYWQVYFDTNRAIRESFGVAGFPAPGATPGPAQRHRRCSGYASEGITCRSEIRRAAQAIA